MEHSTYGFADSGCNVATDEKSVDVFQGASGSETPEDDETAWLKADAFGTAPSTGLPESARALQLSSLDTNPSKKIFQWLDKYATSICDFFSL